MSTPHKFNVGGTVLLVTKRFGAVPRHTFEIVRRLPSEHGYNQYRIKSTTDGHERVVIEGDIASYPGI